MAEDQNTTDLNTLIQQQSTVSTTPSSVPDLSVPIDQESGAQAPEELINLDTNEENVLKEAGVEVFDHPAPAPKTVYATEAETTSMLSTTPTTPIPPIEVSKPFVPASTGSESSAEDLEAQFQSTLQKKSSPANISSSGIGAEKEELLTLLDKIRERLNEKKVRVKDRLDILKRDKEAIAKEIDEIKELEETEQKIKDKVDKLSLLEQEIDSIHDEASQELRT